MNTTKRNWLAILRKSLRFSQSTLADEVGVHVQTVKAWESGSEFPSQPNKLELAKVLGQAVLDGFYQEECSILSSYVSA